MIWNLILGNRVVRFIGAALVAVLGFLTFGMVRRGGKLSAENKALKENAKVQKDINDAVEDSHTGGGSWRERLQRHKAERDR